MPKSQINLLPKEEFEKKPLGRFLLWALSVGRWIVILTELVVILAFLSRFKLDRDLSDLYDQIKQKQAMVASYAKLEQDFRFLQEQIAEIKNLETRQVLLTSVLTEVSQVTPADIALSNFSFDEEGIKISGNALSEQGLGSFLTGLSSLPSLTEITLSGLSQKAGEEAGVRFTLTAKFVRERGKNAI